MSYINQINSVNIVPLTVSEDPVFLSPELGCPFSAISLISP